jgi:hypothetical protein
MPKDHHNDRVDANEMTCLDHILQCLEHSSFFSSNVSVQQNSVELAFYSEIYYELASLDEICYELASLEIPGQ